MKWCLILLFAGVLCALWLRYTGPGTTLSFDIMLDILLMVVIGGMGTMYGAVIGATLFVIAQNSLQDAMRMLSGAAKGLPPDPRQAFRDSGYLDRITAARGSRAAGPSSYA